MLRAMCFLLLLACLGEGHAQAARTPEPSMAAQAEAAMALPDDLRQDDQGVDQIGRPGDVFYVPKGSSITFGTPSWAKFVYVTFPANWEEQF